MLFVALSSYVFKFSTLNVILASEHGTDEFYNTKSKRMFL